MGVDGWVDGWGCNTYVPVSKRLKSTGGVSPFVAAAVGALSTPGWAPACRLDSALGGDGGAGFILFFFPPPVTLACVRGDRYERGRNN